MNANDFTGAVVVGVDGSADSDEALRWAAAEAARRGCPLRIVHATGAGPEPEARHGPADGYELTLQAARTLLDEAAEEASGDHPGLRVETTLSHDRPAAAVLAAADGADMVVLGTRGRGGFSSLLLGSVCLRVAAHTTCPLVVVRGRLDAGTTGCIVVGVQDEDDAEAIRFAAATAARWKASLRALHAWQPINEVGRVVMEVDTIRGLRQTHAEALAQTVEAAHVTSLDASVGQEVVDSGVAAALVEASKTADLLVVAAHRARSPIGLRLGPVVHAVLRHADCPVAVVPD